MAFAVIWFWLRHRDLPPGETFTIYVAAYATFRFLVEFVRGNEVAVHLGGLGLTRPQLVLAATIPLVLARLALQVRKGATVATARRPNAVGAR